MPPTLSWLDSSEHDRQRMRRVIDLFREHDTRDELGIGTVRDALSDLLFPGLTTIQTRPRYFLLIPWAYKRLEPWARRTGASREVVERRARDDEIGLLKALKASQQEAVEAGAHDDAGGVIGYYAGATLKQLPSQIYWQGMGTFGIRLFPGSRDQLHRTLRYEPALLAAVPRAEGDDAAPAPEGHWHAGMPEPPNGFPDGQSLKLAREEAAYLRDRIQQRVDGTLLAWFAANGKPAEGVEAAWAHPQAGELPARLAEPLEHARVFAELMTGAILVYNLLLSQKLPNDRWIGRYERRLAEWAGGIEDDSRRIGAWDREAFWELAYGCNPRIPAATRAFVDRWIDLALEDPAGVGGKSAAAELLTARELRLKGPRARLVHRRALELYSGGAGTEPMTYRWREVSQLVTDLRAALDGGCDG